MAKEKKPFRLNLRDKEVYNFLENGFNQDQDKWFTKQELLDNIPSLYSSKATSHDICSTLNLIRIRLNRGCNVGLVNHIVLLKNGCFKLAKSKDEAEEYLKRDYNEGIKRLVRYYENKRTLKRDGQGTLFDPHGNPIDENNYEAMFRTIFAVATEEEKEIS